MIEINFDNVYKVEEQLGVSVSSEKHLSLDYFFRESKRKIQTRNQGWITYPQETLADKSLINKIKSFAAEVQKNYEDVVILGIGGSMLGPKCVIESLGQKNQNVKFHFLDNIDPVLIKEVDEKINYAKAIFLVQTKSGATPETISQYLYFRDKVEKNGYSATNHFVFVTDPFKGWLRELSKKENILTFDIPRDIGGRFSVLTPVGLLAAAIAGLDFEKILEGADYIAKRDYTEERYLTAFQLATANHLLNEKGLKNLIIMPYSSKLKTLAEWSVQLYSESLGKELDNENNVVNKGITPIPAIGATDQHSQVQLFKEGPFDKQILFVELEKYLDEELEIPFVEDASNADLSYLKGATFEKLIKAELDSTRKSLTESNRANIALKIEKLNEETLGALFMFFQLSVAFMGELMNINTFNQPGVERAKELTKEALS